MRSSTPGRIPQKRSLGQVFLRQEWPVHRMTERLVALGVQRVLEIGPGEGVLTRALLGAGLDVTSVEKDDRFAARLAEQAGVLNLLGPGRLTPVNADILRYDWDSWIGAAPGRAAVVGNIPYNISSPILQRAIAAVDRLTALLFMTQLEFAARVAARPSTKDFGSLTVYAQLRADIALEFKVGRECFQPVPKVDSAVLLLTPRAAVPPLAVLASVELLTRAAFSQRRKQLRNSVRPFLLGKAEADCPIDLARRADALSPAEFVELAAFLFGAGAAGPV